MSPETYAQVSNLLIPTATVIYVLALISHAMEWALGRTAVAKAAVEQEADAEVLVGSAASPAEVGAASVSTGSGSGSAGPSTSGAEGVASERLDAASRIGLLLTWLAFVHHLGGVVTRGLAAGRVP